MMKTQYYMSTMPILCSILIPIFNCGSWLHKHRAVLGVIFGKVVTLRPIFWRQHFQLQILEWKVTCFDQNFTEVCSQGSYWQISQHWFRQWFGAVRHQVIIRTNADNNSCHRVASPGLNGLKLRIQGMLLNVCFAISTTCHSRPKS